MDEVEGRGHLIVHSAIEAHASVPDCRRGRVRRGGRGGTTRVLVLDAVLRDAGVSIDIQTTLES